MTDVPENTVFDSEMDEHVDQTNRVWVQRPILMVYDEVNNINHRITIDKKELVIGRDGMVDITLADGKASRRHASLTFENFEVGDQDPRLLLKDLNSTNGTFVNGVRIGDHYLQDRDRILIGSTQIGFFLREENELEAEQKLLEMASYDALTKLYNRGVFNLEVQREFDRARRYGRELSLVMLDIDHFKKFNDTYGHQAGDFVLQKVAGMIADSVRANDIGARYGGEEFAIILPETNLEGATIQAERLRQTVAESKMSFEGQELAITISMGVTGVEQEMRQVDQMIKAADQALYQAKAHGRNCSCVYHNGRVQSADATF